MPSKQPTEAYVWIWLPNAEEPVVAGKLEREDGKLIFNYGQSYLSNKSAISLYDKELPLKSGKHPLGAGLTMPGCIRDGSPDAWGKRVLINRILGESGNNADLDALDDLTYLLNSGSDRIGALDFQASPTHYVGRTTENASLEELMSSAEKVEKGQLLSPDIDSALYHGSSIGGARPKALIEDTTQKIKYIAKFSSSDDVYSVVKAEFIAMRLAKLAGLQVAPVKIERVANKDVLLIERFDRVFTGTCWCRKSMLSALTLFGLDEMTGRYASYQDLAEILRTKTLTPEASLKELFSRLVFNILCGNTDDHAKNHAVFWDGKWLELTPAYDLCPQNRSGGTATQAMKINGQDNWSRLQLCIETANDYLLGIDEAKDVIKHQVTIIKNHWDSVCMEANLAEADKKLLFGRMFLNPYAFENCDLES